MVLKQDWTQLSVKTQNAIIAFGVNGRELIFWWSQGQRSVGPNANEEMDQRNFIFSLLQRTTRANSSARYLTGNAQ